MSVLIAALDFENGKIMRYQVEQDVCGIWWNDWIWEKGVEQNKIQNEMKLAIHEAIDLW